MAAVECFAEAAVQAQQFWHFDCWARRQLERVPTDGTFVATLEPVPEPATLSLVGLGLFGIARQYRRRAR